MEIVTELVAKSKKAQAEFESMATQELIDSIVTGIAKAVYDNAEPLARMAVDESRMGVYEDKVKKNQGKARIICSSLKGVKSMGVIKDDPEGGITEIARPVGVVAAITPCTNPIVTPMCNAMFAIKGRNSIIIAPHPRGRKCAKAVVDMFREVIKSFGAPEDIVLLLEEPSTALSAQLMAQADVVVATGGMGMVKAAYSSGRPAFGVGAGNVQCIIDRGVDYTQAVPKIIEGRRFDNGIICSGEQTIILPKEEYDNIINMFVEQKCVYIEKDDEVRALRETLFPQGVMNKELVGQNAAKVAELAGIKVPADTKVLLVKAAETTPQTAPQTAPTKPDLFSKEKMCPVISTYSYDTWKEAVEIAQANLNVEGRGHSVSIHSNSDENIKYAAEHLTVCRFLINQICSTMNGGSFYNNLTPTTTLGCGSWGNNSISENFSHKHLLNIVRIARSIDNVVIPSDEEVFG